MLVLSLKRRDHESCMLPVMAGTMVSTCLNTICFAIKQCNLHPTSPQNMVLAAKRNAWMNLRWAFWNIGLCTLEACRKDCRLFGEGGWTAALCSTSATEECRKSPPSTEPQEHVTLTRQVRYGRYLGQIGGPTNGCGEARMLLWLLCSRRGPSHATHSQPLKKFRNCVGLNFRKVTCWPGNARRGF